MNYRQLATLILSLPEQQQQQTVTALVEGETIPLNFAHETVVDDALNAGHLVLSPDEISNMRAIAADPAEVTTTTSFRFRLMENGSIAPRPKMGIEAQEYEFSSREDALGMVESDPELFYRKYGEVALIEKYRLEFTRQTFVDTGII